MLYLNNIIFTNDFIRFFNFTDILNYLIICEYKQLTPPMGK